LSDLNNTILFLDRQSEINSAMMNTRLIIIIFCFLLLKVCIAPEPKCDHKIDSCKAKVRQYYILKDRFYTKCVADFYFLYKY